MLLYLQSLFHTLMHWTTKSRQKSPEKLLHYCNGNTENLGFWGFLTAIAPFHVLSCLSDKCTKNIFCSTYMIYDINASQKLVCPDSQNLI